MAEAKPPSPPDLGAALAAASCPVPAAGAGETILMAHGGGGRLTQRLIESLFLRNFDNPALRELHDGAILDAGGVRLAFSTDSFVIPPGRRLLAVPGSGDHRTAAAVRRLWAMIVMSKWKALAFKPR